MRGKKFYLRGQYGSSIVMQDVATGHETVLLEPVDRELNQVLLDMLQRVYNVGFSEGERAVKANLARTLGL